MRAPDRLEQRRPALKAMAKAAREEARASGANSYFVDLLSPGSIIEERPDGKRVKIDFDQYARHLAAE